MKKNVGRSGSIPQDAATFAPIPRSNLGIQKCPFEFPPGNYFPKHFLNTRHPFLSKDQMADHTLRFASWAGKTIRRSGWGKCRVGIRARYNVAERNPQHDFLNQNLLSATGIFIILRNCHRGLVGTFQGLVEILQKNPPQSFTLRVERTSWFHSVTQQNYLDQRCYLMRYFSSHSWMIIDESRNWICIRIKEKK